MNKKFRYECDGGTIMLGNESNAVCFPNGYGDGEFTVEVTTEKTYGRCGNVNLEWLGTVQGNNIHIYDYDCLYGKNLTDEKHILFTLPKGRWAVYALNGYILIEQWD